MKEMVGGCCVCSDELGWTENPLVYCDGQGCNVAVHQGLEGIDNSFTLGLRHLAELVPCIRNNCELKQGCVLLAACYGIIQVPTGPWFCRKCESQERAARVNHRTPPKKETRSRKNTAGWASTGDSSPKADIVSRGGMAQVEGWAHVVCALYIPEIRFGNVTTMEPIILQCVPQERYNKSCSICEEQGKANIGACMQCNKPGCKHAQAAGLLCEEAGNYMDNVKYCGYCQYHYQKLSRGRCGVGVQKKDSHIKPIPAFKPIPSDNATPEPSPEKAAGRSGKKPHKQPPPQPVVPPPPPLDDDSSTNSSPEGAEEMAALAAEDGDGTKQCEDGGAGGGNGGPLSSKFTTANFTETVITQSGSPVFGSDRGKRSKSPSSTPSYSTMYENFITGAVVNSSEDKKKTKRPSGSSSNSNGPSSQFNGVVRNGGSKGSKRQEEEDSPGSPMSKKRRTKSSPMHSSFSSSSSSVNLDSVRPPRPPSLVSDLKNGTSPPPNLDAAPGEFVLPPRPSKLSAGGDHQSSPHSVPQTLEQLLERQWEQGSTFLMEQAQHFDIASLLSCLHQLRVENNRLEDQVSTLLARRDHLLAVNARLAVPLGTSPYHMRYMDGASNDFQRKSPAAYSPAAASASPMPPRHIQ
ncbi:MLLT6, partial [Cordylochernes scorpioides]